MLFAVLCLLLLNAPVFADLFFTVSHAEHFQPHLQGLLLPAPGKVGYSFPIDYCPCQPEQ